MSRIPTKTSSDVQTMMSGMHEEDKDNENEKQDADEDDDNDDDGDDDDKRHTGVCQER
jgi:hypothetical protein